MEKKYILTDNHIFDLGIKMFQIKCTKAFGSIKEGELGGFIEKEANLSQDGDAWVYGDARVYGDADIDSNDKHCGFDCFGSQNRHTHAYMTRRGEVEVTCGCFTCGCFRGTFDAFVRKVEETHAGTVYEKQYKAIAKLIKIKFKLD